MLTVFILTIALLFFVHWLLCKPFFWAGTGIPYKIPWPIIGSMSSTLRRPIYEVWPKMAKEAGGSPLYGIHVFGSLALLVNDVEIVKLITIKDADNFQAHGMFEAGEHDPLSHGVFFVEGEQWKETRHKMSPYFTPSRMKKMLPIFEVVVDKFVEQVTKSKQPVEVFGYCTKIAVDTVMSAIFGLDAKTVEQPNSIFSDILSETRTLSFLLRSILQQISPTLYDWLGLTIFSTKSTQQLTMFSNEMLEQRLKGIGNRPDFMEGMKELFLKEDENSLKDIKEKYADGTLVPKFTRETIAGHCIMMFGAGTETSGNMLAFLLYELALNSQVQETSRREINFMMERTKGDYDLEDLFGLKYVQMVLKETLRKHPLFTAFGRKCTKDYRLNNIKIPKGTLFVLPAICFHHNPTYFPEPEKFKPERFENENEVVPGSYIGFGSGSRTCLGRRFSETELILILVKMLPKYRLSPCSLTEIPLQYRNMFILSPNNRLWLNIEKITNT